jgi:hypothetical protein
MELERYAELAKTNQEPCDQHKFINCAQKPD